MHAMLTFFFSVRGQHWPFSVPRGLVNKQQMEGALFSNPSDPQVSLTASAPFCWHINPSQAYWPQLWTGLPVAMTPETLSAAGIGVPLMRKLDWTFVLSLFHMVISAADGRLLALTMGSLCANSHIVSTSHCSHSVYCQHFLFWFC